jgi:hypothetical protein
LYDVLTRVGSCSWKLKPFDDRTANSHDTQPCTKVKCERKGCGIVIKS